MSESWKKFFYILGIIAAIYLLFKFIVPIVFRILGWVIDASVFILMWGIIIFLVVLLIGYLVKLFKK